MCSNTLDSTCTIVPDALIAWAEGKEQIQPAAEEVARDLAPDGGGNAEVGGQEALPDGT